MLVILLHISSTTTTILPFARPSSMHQCASWISPNLKTLNGFASNLPSATASFYFKGKQMTVANIARELGVAYVVDGSLRKADTTLRVAARLVRADNGFVVETLLLHEVQQNGRWFRVLDPTTTRKRFERSPATALR